MGPSSWAKNLSIIIDPALSFKSDLNYITKAANLTIHASSPAFSPQLLKQPFSPSSPSD